VEVEYEPSLVSFEKLLEVFWRNHDPQVPEHSTFGPHDRLRSVVVYTNDEQRIRALMAKIQLERTGRYQRPVATSILPASDFSPSALGRDEPRDVWRPLRLHESGPDSPESGAPGDDRTAP
jgi:peptide-methionine (S)-S-oxide reductase